MGRGRRGFTLIELMIVVVIIGVLAAIAMPQFGKYIRRTKTTEALTLLRKIYDGEVAYFDADHVSRTGTHISAQFVSAGPDPSQVPGANKVLANFSSEGWTALKFALDAPVIYRYEAIAGGTGTLSSFTARAEGDLDDDGTTSLFERTANVDSNGNVTGGSGVYNKDAIE